MAFALAAAFLSPAMRQHLLDVLLVLGLGVGQLGVVRLQVVVAVRHAQAALADVGDVLGRILVVLVDAEVEGHADADLAQVGQQGRQLGLVLQRGDLVQLSLQRGRAQLFQARLVHEAGVEVADALGVGALGGVPAATFSMMPRSCGRVFSRSW
jgi:hypothetical protein